MRTFKRLSRVLVPILVVLFVASPAVIKAQDVANGSATATLLAALQVTGGTLVFGNVYQGVAKTVANNDANAGVFQITGAADAQVSIYMQLPDYLQGPTNDRMVVAFGVTDAQVDSTGNIDPTAFGAGWPNANPHAFPAATRLGGNHMPATAVNGTIFLGGKVIPSVNQTAGNYTADIVLTVSYTGA
jgi:hypothetical protein